MRGTGISLNEELQMGLFRQILDDNLQLQGSSVSYLGPSAGLTFLWIGMESGVLDEECAKRALSYRICKLGEAGLLYLESTGCQVSDLPSQHAVGYVLATIEAGSLPPELEGKLDLACRIDAGISFRGADDRDELVRLASDGLLEGVFSQFCRLAEHAYESLQRPATPPEQGVSVGGGSLDG